MPLLDVSDLILDPDFCEELTIYRRQEIVSNKGRATTTPVLIVPAPWGVVEPQEDSPLERKEDFQDLPQLIEVHTQYRLRSASETGALVEYQPDTIIWNETTFLVMRVINWSKYGRGYIRALCAATQAMDLPPQ